LAEGHIEKEKCQMEEQKSLEQWAVVELFGHQKIAGLITEATIGGCSFVRVDVPGKADVPGFTKLYGNGAIYAISFVSEEIARRVASYIEVKPVQPYEMPRIGMGYINEDDDDPAGY
jgi:hypothetical protein